MQTPVNRTHDLTGLTIAIVATDGVEQVELTQPREALVAAGADTELISLEAGSITGYNHLTAADDFTVDATVGAADAARYDGLLLPGGVANPDALRTNDEAVAFIKAFADEGKPVAAICHAAWTLVEGDVLKGRTLTSWPSLKTDIRNAGATWVDEEVVVDGNLVTSRKPDDLDAFCDAAIEAFAKAGAAAPNPALIAP